MSAKRTKPKSIIINFLSAEIAAKIYAMYAKQSITKIIKLFIMIGKISFVMNMERALYLIAKFVMQICAKNARENIIKIINYQLIKIF